jgi:hypothetical protein
VVKLAKLLDQKIKIKKHIVVKESKLFLGILYLASAWVVLALAFQVGMMTLSLLGSDIPKKVSNQIYWTINDI